MQSKVLSVFLVLLSIVTLKNKCVFAKIFDRCELAQELRYQHNIPIEEVGVWVCIAAKQSNYDTRSVGSDFASGYHGLFQISDQFWCSPPGNGLACGINCRYLEDDDIGDDLRCTRQIYEEHQRLSGDGFNAWPIYQQFCRWNAASYSEGCFDVVPTFNVQQDFSAPQHTTTAVSKSRSKVYERCELARELKYTHKIPMEQIGTWVCIAKHESNFNTSAIGRLNYDGSEDHGLFQISDIYWCSPPGKGWVCGLSCDKLEDDDISDDVNCMLQIYEEHTRLSGDGFNAWTVYNGNCKGRSEQYAQGCFDEDDNSIIPSTPQYQQQTKQYTTARTDVGKVYKRCELANELRFKHNIPTEQVATWVCIAKHESNFNTSAIGSLNADGSGDHGLFQISDIYWCSPPGMGRACGLSCEQLEDNDITDDVMCMKKIYEEHRRLSGDGFNAWTVYQPYCKSNAEKYVRSCFDEVETNEIVPFVPRPGIVGPTVSKKPLRTGITNTGKVYERCELARELRYVHGLPDHQIATWVCIANFESRFNTSAIGRLNADGSEDHGLFQISDIYWCSPPGKGKGCGATCAEFEDDDIADDVECIRKIHDEHTLISGDGFNAWTVYNPHCRGRADGFINGCFDQTTTSKPTTVRPTTRATTKKVITTTTRRKTTTKTATTVRPITTAATSTPIYKTSTTTQRTTTPKSTTKTRTSPATTRKTTTRQRLTTTKPRTIATVTTTVYKPTTTTQRTTTARKPSLTPRTTTPKSVASTTTRYITTKPTTTYRPKTKPSTARTTPKATTFYQSTKSLPKVSKKPQEFNIFEYYLNSFNSTKSTSTYRSVSFKNDFTTTTKAPFTFYNKASQSFTKPFGTTSRTERSTTKNSFNFISTSQTTTNKLISYKNNNNNSVNLIPYDISYVSQFTTPKSHWLNQNKQQFNSDKLNRNWNGNDLNTAASVQSEPVISRTTSTNITSAVVLFDRIFDRFRHSE